MWGRGRACCRERGREDSWRQESCARTIEHSKACLAHDHRSLQRAVGHETPETARAFEFEAERLRGHSNGRRGAQPVECGR